jgi:P4 family phage/plasmid primase-like protien
MFPRVISPPEPQYLIREKILKKSVDIFSSIPTRNDVSEIVDRSVIHINNWFMYGSCKPDCDPYTLTRIYDSELDELDIATYPYMMDPSEFFSIRNKTDDQCLEYCDIERVNQEIHKKSISSHTKIKFKKIVQKHYDIEIIRDLVDILSVNRADDYYTWMEVGWCLHNIDPENTELCQIWDTFSHKSSKYQAGECEKRWQLFRDEGLTIRSLNYWARMDNPDRYKEIKLRDIDDLIVKSKSGTNYDIARVVHAYYSDSFVCSSIKHKIWYEFRNHRWTITEEGIHLRQKISRDIVELYNRKIINNNMVVQNLPEPETLSPEEQDAQKAIIQELMGETKYYTQNIKELKMYNSKEHIMKEARELYYDNEFIDKLDENPYLIGFENGIYDLRKGEFREGRPDDYVTISTGINYTEHEEESETVQEIRAYFARAFVDPDVRHYTLSFLASCLEGVNRQEKFRIWTGTASNGKSKTLELFLKSFGDYCIKFPITLLTGARAKSNAATPEIAQSKGKRFGYFDEPGENEHINVGLMKEYTGNDRIKARPLYLDPIEFKPQFKLLLLCNDLPKVPPNDDGVWRRLEVVEFKSKFLDNPNLANPLEFKKDMTLSEKMNDWREAFMSLLLEHYKIYKQEGIIVPHEIVKYTMEFQKTCDAYSEFMDMHIQSTSDQSPVPILDIYENFSEWYCATNNVLKAPGIKDFKVYLAKKLGKSNIIQQNKYLKGYVLVPYQSSNLEIINLSNSLESHLLGGNGS